MDTANSADDVTPAAEPADEEDREAGHEGALDKLKDVFGKFIGAEGDRHGGRDTDPGH